MPGMTKSQRTMERSSRPEKVDPRASQEVDRSRFDPDVQKCLMLLDRVFRKEITAEQMERMLKIHYYKPHQTNCRHRREKKNQPRLM